MPYQLIHSPISQDTVTACEELLAAAQDGHIIGLGVVIIMKRRRFMVDCCGEAARDPVFTRGALKSLDDWLHDIVARRMDSDTTIQWQGGRLHFARWPLIPRHGTTKLPS